MSKFTVSTFRAIACLALMLLVADQANAQRHRTGCTDGCTDQTWLTAPQQPLPGAPTPEQPDARIIQSVPDQPAPPTQNPLTQTPPTQTPPTTGQPPANFSSPSFSQGLDSVLANPKQLPGYIDPAAPTSQFRIRYDNAGGFTRPDRASFLYARIGGPGPAGLIGNSINYEDISAYIEFARNGRWSVFAQLPYRWMDLGAGLGNSGLGGRTDGIGDIQTGFKYALLNNGGDILTFALRAYIPSGDAGDGLGTDHWSIEPGLLFQKRLSNRATIFGELRDWIPVGGTNFDGNVLRYGVGASYTIVDNCNLSITPIAELVGWSVLDGLETSPVLQEPVDAGGTNILNAKIGVRLNFQRDRSLYVGFGEALTSDTWYDNIFRFDYTVFF